MPRCRSIASFCLHSSDNDGRVRLSNLSSRCLRTITTARRMALSGHPAKSSKCAMLRCTCVDFYASICYTFLTESLRQGCTLLATYKCTLKP